MHQKSPGKRLINLASAIIALNETIYQPTTAVESLSFLSQSERTILCELRQSLIKLSDSAHIKLKSEVNSTFDQETINEQQTSAIKTVFKETIASLELIIEQVRQSLSKSQASRSFVTCLADLLPILQGALTLVQNVGVEKANLNLFSHDSIYQLCQQLGILYIPVDQALDPFLGGHQDEGKVESSQGECAGKVTSWLEACAQTSEIHYPFYAGKFDRVYHDQQREISKKYSAVHISRDLFEFTDVVFSKLKRNALYKITVVGESDGHALGLRIRQDGVFELFDPNYLHAFAIKTAQLKVILKYLLVHYVSRYKYDKFGCFAADIVQSQATLNLFPHRMHIIQAENKVEHEASEQLYKKILIKTYNQLQAEFKKNPSFQPVAHTVFANLLECFANVMHSPNALAELIRSMSQINLATSFIQSPENMAKMLLGLEKRLTRIKDEGFQSTYREKQVIITTLKKLLEEVTEEINKLKSQQAESARPHNEKIILILIQQSLKLWRMLRKLNASREKSTTLPSNAERLESKTFLCGIMNEVFGVESQASDLAHFQEEARIRIHHQMQTVSQRFSQSPVTDKRLMLMVVTENLLEACNHIRSEQQVTEFYQLPANEHLLQNLLTTKLRLLRNKLQGFLNDLKVSEQPEELARQFQEIFPLQNESVLTLLNCKRSGLLRLIRINTCNSITKEELRSLTNPVRAAEAHEVNQLSASLTILIDYIESVRDDYVTATVSPLPNNTRNPMTIVLAAKIQHRIEQFNNRIRELKRCRDILESQTKQGIDPVIFTRIASQIRQNYRGLFPVDFHLPANFVHLLDQLIERHKVIVLTAEDMQKVKSLATSFEILKNSHQNITKYLDQMREMMKDLDEKDITTLNKTRGILVACRTDFDQYLTQIRNPDQIIDYVRSLSLVMPVQNNSFDFSAYLQRTIPLKLLIPKSTKNKINILVDSILHFDQRIALSILKAAYIELTDDNRCALKDYGLRMANILNRTFADLNLGNSQNVTILKSHVIVLNSLFRGLRGPYTDPFWKELQIGDDMQTEDRHKMGLAMFLYYRERVSAIEIDLNKNPVSRFSIGLRN